MCWIIGTPALNLSQKSSQANGSHLRKVSIQEQSNIFFF
jgi:hypothetical protein